nr:chemosensory protein 5 [Cephus cinctus]
MRFIPVFLACLTVAFAQEYYSSKFDNINIKEIIDNTRLFAKYKECVLQEKATRCPQEALELKRVLPEALGTLCAKCTPSQVTKIREGLSYACKNRRVDYDEILRHVDPQGDKIVAFEQKFGKVEC